MSQPGGIDLVKVFQDAFLAVPGKVKLVGNTVLVQKLPVREVKSEGGIIFSTGENRQVTAFDSNQPEFVRILAVGEGYYSADGKDVPIDLKPGNIIQVGKSSVNWFTSFGTILFDSKKGRGIGLTVEGESKMIFEDEDSYNKFMDNFFKLKDANVGQSQ